jgi:hypothetical protein
MNETETIDRLRTAIKSGDLATVRSLVEENPILLGAVLIPGPNRNYRPLTLAAVSGQLDLSTMVAASARITIIRCFERLSMTSACPHWRCLWTTVPT